MDNQATQPLNLEDFVSKLQEENAGLRLRIAELEYDRIVEREALRAELRQARETTEAARRGYEDMLRVSYDIRTLLSGIINQVILLLGSELSAKQRESAEKLELSRNLLMRLINDIFDFAKIKAGKLRPDYQVFSLTECIERSLLLLAPRATERGLGLTYIIEEQTPTQLMGDSELLRQILMNLVSEVIMWTRGKSVVILVRPASSTETRPSSEARSSRSSNAAATRLQITVSNMTRVDEFAETRVHAIPASSDNNPMAYWLHSSLGLPISYQLVEVMGGRISMEKEDDRIATFHMTIPFEDATSSS